MCIRNSHKSDALNKTGLTFRGGGGEVAGGQKVHSCGEVEDNISGCGVSLLVSLYKYPHVC